MWSPSKHLQTESAMAKFKTLMETRHQVQLPDYQALHQWACDNPTLFWAEYWDFSGLKASRSYDTVLTNAPMPTHSWFKGALLNYAENCLSFKDDHVAIINADESGEINRTTYKELYEKVSKCQRFLKDNGISKGDRVAAIATHCEETIVMFLATASIGAIWTSCSPDFGEEAILSRFQQVSPTCLIFVDAYTFKGKQFPIHEKLSPIIETLNSVSCYVQLDRDSAEKGFHNATCYTDIMTSSIAHTLTFEPLPFDHPLYILYSSGTTGKPKSIVHSAGGSLIEHLKEQQLHCNLSREDVFFYYTSCSWMMWNWQVSGLASGCTLVVFDGAPFYPSKLSTWQLIDDYNITIYGTSAKYINASLKFKLKPKETLDLSSLRSILSTGSPLFEEDFDHIYQNVHESVQLSSISGGTDIVGCFALGNPIMDVRRGELQSVSLGYPVAALDDNGEPITNEKGELVCNGPCPSMPISFWNDKDHQLYKSSYFSKYPNIWHHSDFIILYDHGGLKVLGRSDSTLNRSGIRIGTSEIYRVVEGLPFVADSLVIHIEKTDMMILFICFTPDTTLSPETNKQIQTHIRSKLSPRHAPNRIYAVPSIPYTKNGKKIELAVKHIFTNNESRINISSLADPSTLEAYKAINDTHFSATKV